jgi:hypothetical protein
MEIGAQVNGMEVGVVQEMGGKGKGKVLQLVKSFLEIYP